MMMGPDYLDKDSDNDGILDECLQIQDPLAYIPGIEQDTNCNGLDDSYDPQTGGVSLDGDYDGDGNTLP